MNASLPAEFDTRALAESRRRSTYVLIGVFWLFTFAVLSIRAGMSDVPPFNVLAPRRFVAALFGTMLCLCMVYLLNRLKTRSFPERIAWGVAGALVMSVLLATFSLLFNRVLLPFRGAQPIHGSDVAQWVMVWLGYFLAWTGTHLALTYHWEAQDQQRHITAMRELAQEARMAALRYQVNPHFLFNTLNSISSLVLERRNGAAEAMLLNLSTFLRSTLEADPAGTIELGREIALQRLYLAIEEERFAERMCVIVDIPGPLSCSMVPALILQPLVENAIRHGVGPSETPTIIRIEAELREDELRLAVENEGGGDGPATGGTGLGLNNVRERLHAHFGERGRLETERLPGGGFRAEIGMPWLLRT